MKWLLIPALLLPGIALADFRLGPGDFVASPVLVASTTGPASITATSNGVETNIAVIRIPANSIGKNGSVMLSCLWSHTNSANIKTLTVRLGAVSGSVTAGIVAGSPVPTTTATTSSIYFIHALNSTSSETSYAANATLPFGSSAAAILALTSDTTVDLFLNLNGTLALGSETITMQKCTALVMKAP